MAEQSASCRVVSETRAVRDGDQATATSSPALESARPPENGRRGETAPSPAPLAGAKAHFSVAAPPDERRPWGARCAARPRSATTAPGTDTESALRLRQRTARAGPRPLRHRRPAAQLHAARAQPAGRPRPGTLSSRTPKNERNDRLYEVALRYEPPSDKLTFELGRVGVYTLRRRRLPRRRHRAGAVARRPAARGLRRARGRLRGPRLRGSGRKLRRLPPPRPRAAATPSAATTSTLAFVREDADGRREPRVPEPREPLRQRQPLVALRARRARPQQRLAQGPDRQQHAALERVALGQPAPRELGLGVRLVRRSAQLPLLPATASSPRRCSTTCCTRGCAPGVNWYRPRGFGATVGVGMSLKEKDPRHPELDLANAYSLNAGLRHANLFGSGFSVGLDGSGFSNGYTDGGLVSLRGRPALRGGPHARPLVRPVALPRQARPSENRHDAVAAARRAARARPPPLRRSRDLEYDAGDDLEGPRVFVELGSMF